MFCPYCGKQIDTDNIFCSYCGKKVETLVEEKAQQEKKQKTKTMEIADESVRSGKWENVNLSQEETLTKIKRKYHILFLKLLSDIKGGKNDSVTIDSIVEIAKGNGLNPFNYLKHLFKRLPNINIYDQEALDDLLPWSNALPQECRNKQELENNNNINSVDFNEKSNKASELELSNISFKGQNNKKNSSYYKLILVVGISVLAIFMIFKFLVITKTDLQKYADTGNFNKINSFIDKNIAKDTPDVDLTIFAIGKLFENNNTKDIAKIETYILNEQVKSKRLTVSIISLFNKQELCS